MTLLSLSPFYENRLHVIFPDLLLLSAVSQDDGNNICHAEHIFGSLETGPSL